MKKSKALKFKFTILLSDSDREVLNLLVLRSELCAADVIRTLMRRAVREDWQP